ncbi:MAG: hypothetical protein ACT4OF_03095 [Caulobacteraceae bacterium]
MSGLRAVRGWMASSTIAHVAFGFLAMGAWAVFANRAHPLSQSLLAGLVQGTISGTLTLFLKKGLERMSAMFLAAPASDEGMGRNIAALIVPPVITATIILAILVTAHMLAGTPEIAATIAVPFAVSTSYAILYNLRLWRQANGR